MTERASAMLNYGRLARLCSLGALAFVVLQLMPARVQARCLNVGCTPVYNAHIICCNRLVYTPGVEGFGADRSVDCDDYLRNQATPEEAQALCQQIRHSNLVCPAAQQSCYDPKKAGNNCPPDLDPRGKDRPNLYVQYTGGRYHMPLYDEPSETASHTMSSVSGPQLPWGTILDYDEVRQVNGETWYHVGKARCIVKMVPVYDESWSEWLASLLTGERGRPDAHAEIWKPCEGWARAQDVSCTRPSTVPPPQAAYPPYKPETVFARRN
ncbi:MAG: hypothetical protein WD076_05135 [Parvularculaceae bacterium]